MRDERVTPQTHLGGPDVTKARDEIVTPQTHLGGPGVDVHHDALVHVVEPPPAVRGRVVEAGRGGQVALVRGGGEAPAQLQREQSLQ
eukprot:6515172-Pyramimonas_sp.AAC.1